MSAVPPSTPFPVPGLNGTSDNATPAEFLSFLRNLINEYLGDNCPRITKKDTWVTVVNGLTDHLLGTFPLPDVVSWNAMQEKVEMTEVSLEVIKTRLSTRRKRGCWLRRHYEKALCKIARSLQSS